MDDAAHIVAYQIHDLATVDVMLSLPGGMNDDEGGKGPSWFQADGKKIRIIDGTASIDRDEEPEYIELQLG